MLNLLTSNSSLIHLKFYSASVLLVIVLTQIITITCFADDDDSFVYKSYQTTVYCKSSSPIQYPLNAKQLQSIIKHAIASNKTVKVIGSRHSVTDIICTDGIPISTRFINYTRLSSDGKTVTVGSGAEIIDALNAIHPNRRTLVGLPSYGGITVGGAMGTGAHGSSRLHPNTLSDLAVGLTIIDGLGKIRKITGKNRDLRAFRVHLGLLGAIVNVTFKTAPSFKSTVFDYLDLESILLDGFALRESAIYPWYQMFWFPSTKMVVVSKANYSSPEESEALPGNAQTNLIPSISSLTISAAHKAMEEAQATKSLKAQYSFEQLTKQSLYSEVPGRPPIFAEELVNGTQQFVNPATGWAYRLATNRCSNKCAWENGEESMYIEEVAMAFHINQFVKVITRIKQIFDEMPAAFLLIGIVIRFSRASDGLMSISAGRETFNLEWVTPLRSDPYNTPKDRIRTYQALPQAFLNEFDGRPHWGKNGQYYFTRKVLRRRPRNLRRKFQQAMKKYDPNGVFMNKFGRRMLFKSDELTVDPQTKRCALLDYCLCSKNEDCADFQVCTKFEDRYPICKNKIDTGDLPINPLP